MVDFLIFFADLVKRFPLHLEISYSKTCDWMIRIYKKGCAENYPNSEKDGNNALIAFEQNCDIELCFAKAHVALKEWLLENEGGY